jgi:hypothetical protein
MTADKLSPEQLEQCRAGAEPFRGKDVIAYYEALWASLKPCQTITNGIIQDFVRVAQGKVTRPTRV